MSGCRAQAWALAPHWPAEMFGPVCFCLSALCMAQSLLACRLHACAFLVECERVLRARLPPCIHVSVAVHGFLGQPASRVVACMYGLAVWSATNG